MNSSSSSRTGVTHEAISVRARELWYARGCPTGRDEETWLEAERQLATERLINEQPQAPSSFRRLRKSGFVNIDNDALAMRLDHFGDPGSRSATSVDPTHSS